MRKANLKMKEMGNAPKRAGTLIMLLLIICFAPGWSLAQGGKDTTEIKKGWTFGALPAIAYDTDRGFKYGGLVNFFNYGDGSTYPDYMQSVYLEWSRTTRGSGINQLVFDTREMTSAMPVRLTVDLSYMIENSLDFYGFNGYASNYNPELEKEGSDAYISRMFYNYERNLFHLSATFQNEVGASDLRWLLGLEYFSHQLDGFDFEEYNQDNDDRLRDTVTLYEQYVGWGVIPEKDAKGGNVSHLKAGLIYDTRDQKANPMEGMWSEVLISAAPEAIGNHHNQYVKLSAIHRQYFTLIPRDLNLAVRLGYQGTIAGKAPFYMQSFLLSSHTKSVNREGLGGKKSLRGILRNRIMGDGIAYSNVELRWKFWRLKLFKQQLYVALSGFWDNGMITDPIDFSKDQIPDSVDQDRYFEGDSGGIHSSMGLGLHFALNRNFVVSIDYGRALDRDDGKEGLYIGMDFLY